MKLSMLVLFLAFIPAVLKAGTTGKIAGHVKDSQTNEALAGVNVVIDGTTLGAATDVEGYFAILNVPPGRYTVSASAIGYTRESVTDVAVSVDLTTTLDLQLASTVVEASPEIVITAEGPVIRMVLPSSAARLLAQQTHTLPD